MAARQTFNALAVVATFGLAGTAAAATINFDDQGLVGPSLFNQAVPSPQTIPITTSDGVVTFTGGVILTNTAGLISNTSSVYGTADFGTGLSNPMTIQFTNPVNNFLVDVLNGLDTTIRYLVQDNLGNSSTFDLPSFTSGSGFTTIGFAAAGTTVTISSLTAPITTFDFFVDNIRFNLEITCGQNGCNPTVVPVPAALPLFLAGALGIAGFGFRSRRKQA